MSTHGEQLVERLLNGLPKNKYHMVTEPQITTTRSAHKNPDFIVISASLGVIVLEVKDWANLEKVKQKEVVVNTCDGDRITYKNWIRASQWIK